MGEIDFDAATAVVARGNGVHDVDLQPDYALFDGDRLHGGYLFALGVKALGAASGHPSPATITAHFMDIANVGPAEIQTEVLREGRHTTVEGWLVQDGRRRVRYIGTFADVAAANGRSWTSPDTVPVQLRPPDECATLPDIPVPVWSTAKTWIDADGPPPMDDPYKEPAVVKGWYDIGDGRPTDPARLAFLCDLMPAAIIGTGARARWIPTIELTMHVHEPGPTEGLIRWIIRTDQISRGYSTEDVQLWDEAGEVLLAHARQLCIIREA